MVATGPGLGVDIQNANLRPFGEQPADYHPADAAASAGDNGQRA